MSKKSYVVIFILVVAAGVFGFKIFGSTKNTTVRTKTNAESKKSNEENKTTIDNQEQDTSDKPEIVLSNEPLDSTGIRYGTYNGPKADVSAQINIGNGNNESKTITAKKDQQVSILFTAGIRDELRIDGYNATTNVEPGRESTIQFAATKTGEFPIKLVNTKKTVGILIIK